MIIQCNVNHLLAMAAHCSNGTHLLETPCLGLQLPAFTSS